MPLIRRDKNESASAEPRTESADALIAQLRAGEVEARWSAARGLATHPQAAPALGEALAGEADAKVREAIFTSLLRIAGDASAEVLVPFLRSEDAGLRGGALEALQGMPAATLPRLPALLRDLDPDVRLLAADLARTQPPAVATKLLCDAIEEESHPNVCAAAVDVLAEIGTPDALPTLRRCAERFADEPFLPFAIEVAAERISDSG